MLELSNTFEEQYGKDKSYSCLKSTAGLKTCDEDADAGASDLKKLHRVTAFDDDLSLIVPEKH